MLYKGRPGNTDNVIGGPQSPYQDETQAGESAKEKVCRVRGCSFGPEGKIYQTAVGHTCMEEKQMELHQDG